MSNSVFWHFMLVIAVIGWISALVTGGDFVTWMAAALVCRLGIEVTECTR